MGSATRARGCACAAHAEERRSQEIGGLSRAALSCSLFSLTPCKVDTPSVHYGVLAGKGAVEALRDDLA